MAQYTHCRPKLLRCCPISLTMSWSTGDMSFTGSVRPELASPFSDGVWVPFIWELMGNWAPSPFCWGQPLVCILEAEKRCLLRGGPHTPPSSLSDDEARMRQQYLWLLPCPRKKSPSVLIRYERFLSTCQNSTKIVLYFVGWRHKTKARLITTEFRTSTSTKKNFK